MFSSKRTLLTQFVPTARVPPLQGMQPPVREKPLESSPETLPAFHPSRGRQAASALERASRRTRECRRVSEDSNERSVSDPSGLSNAKRDSTREHSRRRVFKTGKTRACVHQF